MVLNTKVNMSTRIEHGSVIVTPPNTEAPIGSQRIRAKKSSVCSYYLSGKIDEVLETFDHLRGRFFLDLCATYYFCKKPLEMLIKNCSSFYRDEAKDIEANLSYVGWVIQNSPSDAFFPMNPPVFLDSRKYMKLDQDMAKLNALKSICVGDLFELIFSHPQDDVFVLYAAPRADLGDAFTSEDSFKKWFVDHKIEL